MHCGHLATLLLDDTARRVEPVLKESSFGRKIILMAVTTRSNGRGEPELEGNVQLGDRGRRLSNSTGQSISVA